MDVAGGGVRRDGGHGQRRVAALRVRRPAARGFDQHHGMIRVQRSQMLVDRDAAGRRHMTVRRLVGALPRPQAGVALHRVDDPVEQGDAEDAGELTAPEQRLES